MHRIVQLFRVDDRARKNGILFRFRLRLLGCLRLRGRIRRVRTDGHNPNDRGEQADQDYPRILNEKKSIIKELMNHPERMASDQPTARARGSPFC